MSFNNSQHFGKSNVAKSSDGSFGHIYSDRKINYAKEMLNEFARQLEAETDAFEIKKIKHNLQKYKFQTSYMELSQIVTKKQPNINDFIIWFNGHKLNFYPSKGAIYWRDYVLDQTYPYPDYIIKMAEYKTAVYSDIYLDRSLAHWCEILVDEEDKEHAGSYTPLRTIVDNRKKEINILVENIKKHEEVVINAVVSNAESYASAAQGAGNEQEALLILDTAPLPSIPKIFYESIGRYDKRTYPYIVPDEEGELEDVLYVSKSEDLAGLLSDLNPFKILKDLMMGFKLMLKQYRGFALTAVDFSTKILNSVGVSKKLTDRLSQMSEAAVYIASGQINKKNIGDLFEGSYKITTYTVARSSGLAGEILIKVGSKIPGAGSLFIAAGTILEAPEQVYEHEKVDWTQVAISVGVIAATIMSGGTASGIATAVAKQAAVNYISEETGINQTYIGKLVSMGIAVYGGANFGDQATKVGNEIVDMEIRLQIQKTGLLDNRYGQMLLGAIKQEIAGKDGFAQLSTNASSLAKQELTHVIAKEIQQSTGLKTGKYLAKIGDSPLTVIEQANVAESFAVVRAQSEKAIKDIFDASNIRTQAQQKVSLAAQNKLMRERDAAATDAAKNAANKQIEKNKSSLAQVIDEEQQALLKKTQEIQNATRQEIQNIQDEYLGKDVSAFADNEIARLENRLQSQLEMFIGNWNEKLNNLAKKYGMKLLMYLYYMYGPQADYDQYVLQMSQQQITYIYRYWQAPPKIFSKPPQYQGGINWLLVGGIGFVGLGVILALSKKKKGQR